MRISFNYNLGLLGLFIYGAILINLAATSTLTTNTQPQETSTTSSRISTTLEANSTIVKTVTPSTTPTIKATTTTSEPTSSNTPISSTITLTQPSTTTTTKPTSTITSISTLNQKTTSSTRVSTEPISTSSTQTTTTSTTTSTSTTAPISEAANTTTNQSNDDDTSKRDNFDPSVVGPERDITLVITDSGDNQPNLLNEDSTNSPDSETPGPIETKSISSQDSGANGVVEGEQSAKSIDSNENVSGAGSNEEEEEEQQEQDSTTQASTFQAPKPLRHINMTQVDEMYVRGHKKQEEIVESWHRMSKRLKGVLNSIIGSIVPYALNMTQEAKISSDCSGAMLKWVLSMNQLKSWALRMFDASGKPIAGMLEGSLTLFGNYRECLKIRAADEDEMEFSGKFHEHFRGKYCIIQAKPWLPAKESPFYNLNAKLKGLVVDEESSSSSSGSDNDDSNSSESSSSSSAAENTESQPPSQVPEYEQNILDELSVWIMAFNFINVRYDLCIPSLCSREDIQKVISYLLKDVGEIKARVLRCEMDPAEGSYGGAVVESGPEQFMGAMNVEPNSMQQAINSNMIASSTDPIALALMGSSPYLSSFWSRLGWLLVPLVPILIVLSATALSVAMSRVNRKRKPTKLNSTLNTLSLKRSVSSHLSVDYEQLADDKPLALYGIRFILVLWVILVESAVNLKFEYLRELMMLKDFIFWWPMQFVINSTLQFDSIILLTAFTMAYKNCLNDSTNSLRSLLRFVMDKYIRLMPSIMVMVALVIVMPTLYKGPVWNDYVLKQSAACQSTGWLNSIFMQNYLPYKYMCLPQTWLMCIEFQLIILMAPLLYYLDRNYQAFTSSKSVNASKIPASNGDERNSQQHDKENNYNNNNNNHSTNNNIKGEDVSAKQCQTQPTDKFLYWIRTAPGMLLIVCIAIGLGSSFYNVYTRELPPTWFYTMADPESKGLYFDQHLMRLWTHLAVFALGIIAGLECRRASRKISETNERNELSSKEEAYGKKNLAMVSDSEDICKPKDSRSLSIFSTSMPVISPNITDIYESSGRTNALMGQSQNGGSIINNFSNSSVTVNMDDSFDGSNNELAALKSCDSINGGSSARSRRSMMIDIIGCILALATMCTIIFSTHEWSVYDLPAPFVAGLFDAGSRFLWSLALIWILYMVSVPSKKGTFSLLARALGHPFMVFLGKLSFLIYIIHPFVHTAVLAIQEQPIYSSWLMLFHILIGNITITVILASFVSLFVEMPCRNLFRRCETSLLLTNIASTTGAPASSATASGARSATAQGSANGSRPSVITITSKG